MAKTKTRTHDAAEYRASVSIVVKLRGAAFFCRPTSGLWGLSGVWLAILLLSLRGRISIHDKIPCLPSICSALNCSPPTN